MYSIIVNSLLEVITVLLDFLKARFVRVVGQENVRGLKNSPAFFASEEKCLKGRSVI